jgi:hypothetical protein
MTLPPKDQKAYLELSDGGTGPAIEGEPPHIAELEALFNQHGIPCTRVPYGEGREALRLRWGAERDKARAVLDAYKNAQGS